MKYQAHLKVVLKPPSKNYRLPLDYEEPPSVPDKDKVDPIYENVEATAQQSKDVATGDVKMDNPSYDTSVL